MINSNLHFYTFIYFIMNMSHLFPSLLAFKIMIYVIIKKKSWIGEMIFLKKFISALHDDNYINACTMEYLVTLLILFAYHHETIFNFFVKFPIRPHTFLLQCMLHSCHPGNFGFLLCGVICSLGSKSLFHFLVFVTYSH